MLELANSELQSANSSADSSDDPMRIGMSLKVILVTYMLSKVKNEIYFSHRYPLSVVQQVFISLVLFSLHF